MDVENIVRKGEIACYKRFLLFSECFLPCMTLIFHFKCILKCLQSVSVWTSLKFCIKVFCNQVAQSAQANMGQTFWLFVHLLYIQEQPISTFNCLLTLSQTSPGFYVSAVQVF